MGGLFRGMVTGGSWIRLAMWTKGAPGRKLLVKLEYVAGQANWELRLEQGTETIFQGVSSTLEGVTVQAVASLGKAR